MSYKLFCSLYSKKLNCNSSSALEVLGIVCLLWQSSFSLYSMLYSRKLVYICNSNLMPVFHTPSFLEVSLHSDKPHFNLLHMTVMSLNG